MSHTVEAVLEKHHDPVGARIGMWLFLFTELLLFGGMFLLYAVYLNQHPGEFRFASSQLDKFAGAMNTVILLTSSLTMVMAVAAMQRKSRKLAIVFLIITLLLASFFLVNKYFEWGHKIHLGIYPNSPELLQNPHGEIMFYGLYFTMTGLHGLHVIIGMIIMLFLLFQIGKKSTRPVSIPAHHMHGFRGKMMSLKDSDGNVFWDSGKIDEEVTGIDLVVHGKVTDEDIDNHVIKLENAGLYWHLVDIIWIFLFPLFYLISM